MMTFVTYRLWATLRAVTCLFLCFIIVPVFSQFTISDEVNRQKYFLSLHSELDIDANGLTNEFLNSFYKGNFLNSDLKNRSLKRLSETGNTFGYRFLTDAFLNIPGANNVSYYIGFANHNFMELNFTKDFYHLVMYGNKYFSGKDAILSGLSLKFLNYQQLKGGIYKTWYASEARHRLMLGLAYNNGQSLLQYNLPEAKFFTHENAEYVALDMNIQMKRSDTLETKFGAENGAGAALDIGYFFQDMDHIFEVRLENIGFIHWNKNSQYYKKDTIVKFDGVEIPNILDINAKTFDGLGYDSVVNAFAYSQKRKSFTQVLPVFLSISGTKYFFNRKVSLTLNYSDIFFSVYTPQFCVSPALHFFPGNIHLKVSPDFKFGGYGRFNCGLGVSADIKQNFYVAMRCVYLNSLIFPKKSAGAGGYIVLIKTF